VLNTEGDSVKNMLATYQYSICKLLAEHITGGELTPFAQAMPDEYKDEDTVKAYRAYYKSKVDSPGGVHYRHTSPPDWWGVTA